MVSLQVTDVEALQGSGWAWVEIAEWMIYRIKNNQLIRMLCNYPVYVFNLPPSAIAFPKTDISTESNYDNF